jgi:AmmeMemoRadiSam system protein B/AmmeMemoRadiSam system protein A
MMTIDRKPAVAGQFYPADKEKLQHEVLQLLHSAEPKQCNHVRAIICPHAGYVYSGAVAASAFNQIDAEVSYKRIFLIASSHRETFNSGSVYCEGNYLMPYGEVKVDTEFCKSLVEQFPDAFTDNPAPHRDEHSLEVQLPFLHYTLKTAYRIVPIIIGTLDPEVYRRIAQALKPYLNSENLFIISSDFSHYPEYSDARQVDTATKDAILSNNPETLLNTLSANSRKHIPHLSTSLCGWTSVLTLLYMTSQHDSLEYRAIEYRNSGDAPYIGEHDRVVGYWGIAVEEKEKHTAGFQLTESEKETLLDIARDSVEEFCRYHTRPDLTRYNFTKALLTQCGAFVSLHKKGALRGCIGLISSEMPLYQVVQEMAVSACANDHRFHPVEVGELPDIDIEISVLSPLRKIEDIAEIELGKHGILIEKYHHRGLFLPQVAAETGWTKEEFLGHCARDKAGLGWDEWKSANVYVFTATVF